MLQSDSNLLKQYNHVPIRFQMNLILRTRNSRYCDFLSERYLGNISFVLDQRIDKGIIIHDFIKDNLSIALHINNKTRTTICKYTKCSAIKIFVFYHNKQNQMERERESEREIKPFPTTIEHLCRYRSKE
jgi:hypothetical protein